jgi:hypothetical protein
MRLVIVVVALGLTAVSAALGASQYPTVFTKFKYELSGGEAEFIGKIDSSKGACVSDRKVKLFRKHNGEEQKLGGDHTNGKGKFVIDLGSGAPKQGSYHAEVKQAKVGGQNQNTCLARSSPTVKLS